MQGQYTLEENLHELIYAIRNNSGEIDEDDIESLLACVEGENDGYSWHWIVKLKDGAYGYLTGGCDYTGWDCQSSLDHFKSDDLEECLEKVPEIDGDNRDSRKMMREQI